MKYNNIRVLNIEGALRRIGATFDSQYGICPVEDIPKIIRQRLGPSANYDDIIADYANVVQWSGENGLVEYAALGLKDLEICDNNLSNDFLSHILVSFDINPEDGSDSITLLASYKVLQQHYHSNFSEEYKAFIRQLPYAHEWLTK